MKIFSEWKDFKEWKQFINSYQEIDLTEEEKRKLEALGSTIIDKLFHKTKNQIVNRIISDEKWIEYTNWAKQLLAYMKNNIKK